MLLAPSPGGVGGHAAGAGPVASRYSQAFVVRAGERQLNAGRSSADTTAMSNRSLTILLVEDSNTYALLAISLLEGLGHAVARAASGEEGIAMARDLRPNVILMDIHLPAMSGYEAMRVIRQDFALRHIPVIAISLTEAVNQTTIEMGIDAGFTMHTEKPTSEEGFRYLLAAYADYHAMQDDLPAKLQLSAAELQVMVRGPESKPTDQGHPDADR